MKSIPSQPFVIQLDAVDSTNNYAANLLKRSKVVNGTIILTKRQEKGKGQRGANWQSAPDKNLTCSVVLYPEWDAMDIFRLNILTSLAVGDMLKGYGLNAAIKWPNDIYVGNKKIAGILIESQIKGQKIASSIVGVGLNVNQRTFYGSFKATSMTIEFGVVFEINQVARQFWNALMSQIELNGELPLKALQNLYYERLIGYRTPIGFEDQTGQYNGTIVGLDEIGRLCVESTDGKWRKYQIKEVKQFLDTF